MNLHSNIYYVVVVYIPPDSKYNDATEKLTDVINSIENDSPDAVKLVVGDFNQCNFDEHVTHYQQYVSCETRKDKTIDLFYCNVKDSYKVEKKAALGDSDPGF